MERIVSSVGGLVPFETAEKVVWETARVDVSATTIRTTTEAIGAEMEEKIAEGIEQAKTGELESKAAPDVLVGGADGAMVNTREEGWKETKVGRVVAYRRKDPTKLVRERNGYVAHLGNVEAFRPKLDAEVQHLGMRGREATLFLGD